MEKTEEQFVQKLDVLINKHRKFRAAYEEAMTYAGGIKDKRTVSAQIWFRIALTAELLSIDVSATYARSMARMAYDYTTLLEGDLLRDQALGAIRRGQLELASELLQKVAELHAGDANLMACWKMCMARLRAKQRNKLSARNFHRAAYNEWLALGNKANKQWMATNDFHWLKVADEFEAGEIFVRFMKNEPSLQRKVRAVIFHGLGPIGKLIDNGFERVFS